MTVNPDDILIFKMRGIKTAKKKVARAETVQAPRPQAAAARAQAAQPTMPKPAAAMPQQAKPARRPLFAPKQPKLQQQPKPSQAPARIARVPKAAESVEAVARQPTYTQEDEERMRKLADLEQTAALYEAPPGGLEAEELEAKGALQGKEIRNAFSTIAGLLFIADAIVFGYFIFPQSVFVLRYAAQNGIGSFAIGTNYTYGISFVNIILVLLLIVSGISMIAHAKLAHLVSGATGSIILLSVSFEYLNSSETYMLIVSVFTFICVAALAYARMSAVVEVEEEAPQQMPIAQEIDWPRLETF